MRIAILRVLTSVFNGLARWAHNHPGVVVEIATMLAAGVVAAAIMAMAYLIVWLI
jgi:hypothetical protein